MQQHKIIALKEDNKRARCIVCLQAWTSGHIRYGCLLCDTYYRKEDLRWFCDGICQHCQSAAGSWNQLIEWAHQMREEEAIILDITTEPAVRPVSFLGQAPDCYAERTMNDAA